MLLQSFVWKKVLGQREMLSMYWSVYTSTLTYGYEVVHDRRNKIQDKLLHVKKSQLRWLKLFGHLSLEVFQEFSREHPKLAKKSMYPLEPGNTLISPKRSSRVSLWRGVAGFPSWNCCSHELTMNNKKKVGGRPFVGIPSKGMLTIHLFSYEFVGEGHFGRQSTLFV